MVASVCSIVLLISINVAYGQEYYEINWGKVIGYFISNFFLSIQLLTDQGNVDKIYEEFAVMRNAFIDNKSINVL